MNGSVLQTGIVVINDFIVNIDKDGSKDAKCSVLGILGIIFNLAGEKLRKSGFGCRLIPFKSLVAFDSTKNAYDGALGALERKEVDAVLMPVYYPIRDDGENFFYGPVLYEDTMTIFSGYSANVTTHGTDIIGMFEGIPRNMWYGFVLSFLIFVLVSNIGARLLGTEHSSVWMIACAFLDQDNFPLGSSPFMSILSVVTMSGMFFVMQYGTNCMGTDLVTVTNPVAITTYDEIIDNKIDTAFSPVLSEWERFTSAPIGSKERAIFDRRTEKSFDLETVPAVADEIWNQKLVMVMRPFVVNTVAMTILGLQDSKPDRRAYIGADPDAKKYTNVYVMRAGLKGTQIQKRITQVISRLNEHGYAHLILERLVPTTAKKFLGEEIGGMPSHEQKMTSKIEEQSGEVLEIGFEHIVRVLQLFFIGMAVASIVLVKEILAHHDGNFLIAQKDKLVIGIKAWWFDGRQKKVTVKIVTIKRLEN